MPFPRDAFLCRAAKYLPQYHVVYGQPLGKAF
jgi:hypothetical protein